MQHIDPNQGKCGNDLRLRSGIAALRQSFGNARVIKALERLRTLVFGIVLPPSGAGLRVTLSAGLAMNEKPSRSLDELVARADAALYVAKNDGRDLVRFAEERFLTTSGIRRASRQ